MQIPKVGSSSPKPAVVPHYAGNSTSILCRFGLPLVVRMAVVPDLVQAEIFIEDVEVEAVSLAADSSIVVGIVTLRRSAETVVPVETVAIMIGD